MTTTQSEHRWTEQGKRLKRARKRTGLSQELFAPTIGTTRRHLIRLEKGQHRPGGELLGRIAQETSQPVESFGYPADDEEEEPAMRHMSLDDILRMRAREILHEERVALGITG